MTAVLSSMDALKKERHMSMDENGLSFLSNNTDWHSKYNEVLEMLAETKQELDEFHSASKELEAELEAELARTEKSQLDLQVKVSRAETERDDWKSKFMSLQTVHNTTTTSLQCELDKLRKQHQELKTQLRDLEMGNDDLERNERAVSSSLADLEAKYSRVLEEKILLEQELLEKVSLEESIQRLKDDLRDATEEISMLKHRVDEAEKNADKAAAEAVKEYKAQRRMPPPPTTFSPRKASSPPDLDLADLTLSPSPTSTRSTSSASHVSTPKNNGLNKPTAQPASVHRESPVTAIRTSGLGRGSVSNGLYSPSTSTSSRLPTRGTPNGIRTSVSGSSYASGSTTTSTTSRSKGVQMVSKMQSRIENLGQRIHTRVPRLRMTSATRNSVNSHISSVPSSSSSLSNNSTSKTSWESGRPSPDPRRSDDSLDKPVRKDETGWVMITQDSPSPMKDKERERRERKRLSGGPSAPTSYRPSRAHSPSLSSGPITSAYPNMTLSTGTTSISGRKSQSRLSGGGSSTSTVRGLHTSRPTSPTFIPVPSASFGTKRSTGPNGPNPYSSQSMSTRSPALSTSTYGSQSLSSRSRSTTTTMPPLPSLADSHRKQETRDAKALPQVPTEPSSSMRTSRSTSASAVATLLSKSRIGRPTSSRKSGGADELNIDDLRPRSSSFFGGR